MSATNIEVPDSLLKQAQEMAEKANMTLEQFINSALAEKMAAWMTLEYLQQRAVRGDRRKFEQAMNKVPDREPDASDSIQ